MRTNWNEATILSGKRIRLAVLGDGSDAELTATAFEGALAAMKIGGQVSLLACRPEEFKQCVAHLTALGFDGAGISNPFKAEAAHLAPQFFVVRQGLGVANAIKLGKEIYAQNTEVTAFADKIKPLKPGMALVMGSGRAARSAAMALFECGWRIKVWNRNVIRSRPFAVAFETYGKVELASTADPAGCSLIVNATPLGAKAGEMPPVKWNTAGPRTSVIDFVYRGVATEFLRSASKLGFKTVDGRELLVDQARLALEWFLGEPVPPEPMFEAIGFRKAL